MSTNKSFSSETSERYSRALFEVAGESNEIDKVENDMMPLIQDTDQKAQRYIPRR